MNFKSSSKYMVGMVVDRADPQQRGRLRVRWFGYYSDEIPVEQLPWSLVVSPITSAGLAGVGSTPTGAMVGTFVFGSFIDEAQQHAVIFGTINPIEGLGDGDGDGIINEHGILDTNEQYEGPSNATFSGTGPSWFQTAVGEIGTKEFRNGSNPEIVKYARSNGFSDDETPWCASFVKWCMTQAGQSTDGITGMARSFTRSSAFEKISEPLHGCVVVFDRPPNPSSGHVALLDSIQGGRLRVLGGNQSNSVNIQGYATNRLVGMYWPFGASKDGFGV